MKTMVLHLESVARYERIENAVAFTGEDASGSFGILPGHAPIMTILVFGLARYRTSDDVWHYLALPGAMLRGGGSEFHIAARRYVQGTDYEQISTALRQQFVAEEEALESVKVSVRRLEEEMFKRLRDLHRLGEAP
jgi:F-type H+-transporting ATPase subunit epsilon